MARQRDDTSRFSGFTLLEILLALALLALVGTVSLSILPSVVGEPGGNPTRVDCIVRGAMVAAIVNDQNVHLEAGDNQLRYRVNNEIRDEETFSRGVRLSSLASGQSTSQILISSDGMHHPFHIRIGDDEPLLYEPDLQFP